MRVSSLLPTLGGLVASVRASPHLLGGLGGLVNKQSSIAPSVCSLANNWEDKTLFAGIAAPATDVSAAISLGLHLPKAQITGDISLELLTGFLTEPKIRVSLADITAYVEVDISASAAVHESIELFASPALEIGIPGLLEAQAGAAIALDLIVAVGAAVDLSAGVYISFGKEAYVDISLLSKDVVDVSLDGLVAKALPLGIGAEVDLSAEIDLQLGLRLRTEIDLGAELDIPILDIEAGAKIAIWVSLFDYTAVLVNTGDCVVSVSELIALTLGLSVELDVEVGDILDLSLAPGLTITLATAAKAERCQPNRGTPGVFIETPGSSSTSGVLSATTVSTISGDAVPTVSGGVPGASGLVPNASDDVVPTVSGSVDPTASGAVDPTASDDADVDSTASGSVDPTASGDDDSTATGDAASSTSSDASATGSGSGSATTAYGSITTPAVGHGNSSITAGVSTITAGDVTSTVTSTHVYTITSCAASVVNCPARYTQKVVTSTVVRSTFVCPAGETAPVSASASKSAPVPAVTTVTDTLTTIVPCSERTTKTFHAPTNVSPPVATVTIVDSTTVCPVTGETGHSATVPHTAPHVTSGFEVVTSAVSTASFPAVPGTKTPGSSVSIHQAPSGTPGTPGAEASVPCTTQTVQFTSGFQVVTSAVSTVSVPQVPSSGVPYVPGGPEYSVPESPAGTESVPAPAETVPVAPVPFPASNGTVSTKPAPGAPVPTGYTAPVLSSTPTTVPVVASTPSSAPVPPTVPAASGGNMIQGSLLMAFPLVLALLF
ncbi:hypothetical protein AK830_g9845 [Neonectria ditissima]|uniref:Uncharacterized protein n=1 Tax=Neonectria ditissima TaxID=78410 RepID=A0A0N8H5N9_9HYPO|nr:hypothetical protein AK830_g9845 [Neonectria ditissima]